MINKVEVLVWLLSWLRQKVWIKMSYFFDKTKLLIRVVEKELQPLLILDVLFCFSRAVF